MCRNPRRDGRMNLPPTPPPGPPAGANYTKSGQGIIEFQANVSRFAAETRAEMDIRKIAAQEKREKVSA